MLAQWTVWGLAMTALLGGMAAQVHAADAPAAPPAASAASGAAPAAPALLPVDLFFRHADIGQAQLSPSGRHLAISLNVRDRLGLAVIDLQGSEPPRLLLRDDLADIRDFHWVNDRWLVFSLIQLDAGNADQDFGPGLFSVSLDGGVARMLIRVRWDLVREPRTGQEPLDPRHHLMAVPAAR